MVILVLCPLVNDQLVKNELRTKEGWLGQMMWNLDDIICCHEHHLKLQSLPAS